MGQFSFFIFSSLIELFLELNVEYLKRRSGREALKMRPAALLRRMFQLMNNGERARQVSGVRVLFSSAASC